MANMDVCHMASDRQKLTDPAERQDPIVQIVVDLLYSPIKNFSEFNLFSVGELEFAGFLAGIC